MQYGQTLIGHDEFEAGIKEVWKRAESLIYPNTPIEVIVDSTPLHKQEGEVFHFSIYVEGEWRCKAFSMKEAVHAVRHVINTDAFSWETEGMRLNADWPKWDHVLESSLIKICNTGA